VQLSVVRTQLSSVFLLSRLIYLNFLVNSARLFSMRIAFIPLALVLSATLLSSAAEADIYTCRHADGTTELTDTPCARTATVVNVLKSIVPAQPQGTLTTAPQNRDYSQGGPKMVPVSNRSGAQSSGRPGLAAKVEPNVQKARDDLRRNMLSKEMEDEQRALAGIQGKYNGGTLALAPGESAASPQYLERRAQLSQTVSLHEKNLAAIRQEISNLR
jgi:Domain of unknown function (DUF4124)